MPEKVADKPAGLIRDGAVPPVPVVSIAGPSGVGKTALIMGLVAALRTAGCRVAVLKHTRHLVKDTPGKDTNRFMQAGAYRAALVGPGGFLCFENNAEPPLAAVLTLLSRDVDMIMVEGYREAPFPQVRVLGVGDEPAVDGRTVAVVSREPVCLPVRVFHPEDVSGLASFLKSHFCPARGDGHC
uniref:Molybdopterin-guanine dinucleotide biosynthesis protein B n=1 Tax=Ammonifex degensii TaxID=42838 RepID=A0A7C1J7W0_9THEO